MSVDANRLRQTRGVTRQPRTGGTASTPAGRRAGRRRATAPKRDREIEALARALADGAHREPRPPGLSASEINARADADSQDAELIRVAAYAGLRRGELVALRWRDVDFVGRKIVVRQALSAEIELRSTKRRRAREVPLPDQAATALDRLSQQAAPPTAAAGTSRSVPANGSRSGISTAPLRSVSRRAASASACSRCWSFAITPWSHCRLLGGEPRTDADRARERRLARRLPAPRRPRFAISRQRSRTSRAGRRVKAIAPIEAAGHSRQAPGKRRRARGGGIVHPKHGNRAQCSRGQCP